MIPEDEEEDESDPVAEFFATLTSKEKRKLLKRLSEIENGTRPSKK